MTKKILLIVLLFLSFNSFAQGEANIWYFGYMAGLDFNSGSPVVINDSQMITYEGCSTISDANGKLLFYTDGYRVWNKNHQMMPNGTDLLGDSSSTQSGIIIPKPNTPGIYYIFTVPALAGPDGLRYSEVDMSLNGGLGDITSKKNILLYTPSCEKLTAIKNAAGDGYWVLSHGFGNNRFIAYSITENGVNLTPIVSNAGSIIDSVDGDRSGSIGYLKISPNGDKVISSNRNLNVELFDFDNATGIVSNPVVILSNSWPNYGAEFSPSGNIAYVTTKNGDLLQFDLRASNIASTATTLHSNYKNFDPHIVSALQLAPDGKIYGALFAERYVSVINNPDVLGLGSDFVANKLFLGNDAASGTGLPQFIQSYFNVGINVLNNCLGENTTFSLSGNKSITSATWDFGDGTTSTDINPTHTYLADGTFTVSVTATSPGGSSTKTRDIIISKVPIATKPKDILACDNDNDGIYTFDLTIQNTAILNGQDPNLYKVNYFANNVAIPLPTAYANKVAYQKEIITAEISNTANGRCKNSTSFAIDVFDSPLPELANAIPDLTSCDNTSVGTDVDGRIAFDLTQRASAILKGQLATQFSISYYKDAGFTQLITTPTAYQNTISTETIFVKVANKENPDCIATTSFKIAVLALPVVTATANLKQCDDDIDGFSIFNLEEAISKITTNASNETIAFFKTIADAQNNTNSISNTTTYTNTVVSNDVVYVRISNANTCFRIARLNLIVSTTQIPSSFSKSFTQCDDVVSGTNTDGLATFDFSGVTNQIQAIFPLGQLLDITYYKNLNDALAEKNTITNISNYSNVGYPNSQKIYVRVDSKVNNDCLGLGGYITLNVEPIPIVKSLIETQCDDNQDGLFAFNTSTIESRILNGLTNVSISYLDQNNNPLPSPLPNPFVTGSKIVKIKVTNNTVSACSYDTTVEFVVDRLPQTFPIPNSLTTFCDDEIDPVLQDGKYPFDTTAFQNTILGNQTGMIVKYYDANGNALSSPLPNPFLSATQDVKVEVINPVNQSCTATTIIPFKVNSVPTIQLTGDELVCSNLPTFTKTINAGLIDETQKTNYNYIWTLDGNLIVGENRYDLIVNKKGIYKVETRNSDGCSRTRTITVNASDKATVQIDIVDLSTENSITVLATGTGDYVFSLDDESGEYQNSNIFQNVPSGIHIVYVKDLNGCGIVPKEIAVLGIPTFFTPNQDGSNDTWNLKGVNSVFNAKTTIQIFDRYGKLLKEINPMGEGWDGTYVGQQMPATDYWYSIRLEDGRIFKGHFALKR
ncbi:T9SS type B sorting domain-containing protein [Flavobacterium pectinovorum]|uniref:PKD domain-containing protein n=1 Tax=Flavobacterium pectinovorum TaxID=29533 RepID=A0A502EFZ6_9FLAO|nr:T9SS type B sorting domain-containing protein [Flavobacterium pectinovorum]TPG35420.1 PKD domain-containing protein [Flavobacterium pectinovorum]